MKSPGGPVRLPFHYAWVMLGLSFLIILTAVGIRSAPAVMINPLEAAFGWNVAAISTAIAVNLLVYGIAAPVAGRLIDRFGMRPVVLGSLVLLSAGLGGTLFMTSLWHLIVLWGVVVGLGVGGVASVLSAAVSNRWFEARRGLALGILGGAVSAGQIVFLPVLAVVIHAVGWRSGSLFMLVAVLVLLPLVFFWMRNGPEDVGLSPYGAAHQAQVAAERGGAGGATRPAEPPVRMTTVAHSSTFWFLAAAFFICGATSSGLIGTHLIPHAHDHGIPELTAAATFGVMGGMNLVGTILSGWFTDRFDPRKILSIAFTMRGLSLLALPFVHDSAGLFIFGLFYGLDWFATVPPVITLTANTFGKRSVATIYGWIFLSHQVGSSAAAMGGGALRVWLGNYDAAIVIGAIVALIGGGLALGIPSVRSKVPLIGHARA